MSYYKSDLVDRAVYLYFRHHEREGTRVVDQPAKSFCVRRGKYVLIANSSRLLCMFRVTGSRGGEKLRWHEVSERQAVAAFKSI